MEEKSLLFPTDDDLVSWTKYSSIRALACLRASSGTSCGLHKAGRIPASLQGWLAKHRSLTLAAHCFPRQLYLRGGLWTSFKSHQFATNLTSGAGLGREPLLSSWNRTLPSDAWTSRPTEVPDGQATAGCTSLIHSLMHRPLNHPGPSDLQCIQYFIHHLLYSFWQRIIPNHEDSVFFCGFHQYLVFLE